MGSSNTKKLERWFKSYTSKRIPGELEKWSKEYALEINKSQAAIKADMRKRYIKQEMTPYEYYMFKLFGRSEKEKDEFASKWEQHMMFSKSKLNTFPRSKIKRYEIFKSVFKRKVLGITFKGVGEEQAYLDYIKENPVFVVKPSEGTEGRGVFKATAEEIPDLKILKKIVKEECLLEQPIIQGEELAAFHPASINTIRVVSSMDGEGGFQIIHAVIRTGRGESFVDNLGAGGLLAVVDRDNGIVISDGLRGLEHYKTHPDSGLSYKGFVVPKWQELVAYVEKCHRIRPQQTLIGWDFAWTKDGFYDLVEANPNPSMHNNQVFFGKGVKPRFYMIKKW